MEGHDRLSWRAWHLIDWLIEVHVCITIYIYLKINQIISLTFHLRKGLTETQNELRRKEQALRQISKQLSQVEYERDSLESNLKDAENALHSSAK